MESTKNISRLFLLASILILAACSPKLMVTAGAGHTCATLGDGSTKCWGDNYYGQLGLGDTLARGDDPGEMGVNLPVVDLGTNDLGNKLVPLQLAAGEFYTCAVLSDFTVKCWGKANYGKIVLGVGNSIGDQPGEMGNNLPTVNLGTRENGDPVLAVKVVVGSFNTCVITNTNNVKCWGDNSLGQLGSGDRISRDNGYGPAIDLGTDGNGNRLTVVGLAIDDYGVCAALSNEKVKCWGRGIGDGPGEMGNNLPALELGAAAQVVGLTAGKLHTCARLKNGSVKCWGKNVSGQLGVGNTTDRNIPHQLNEIPPSVNLGTDKTASKLAAGYSYTCARVNYGVKCWGYNIVGQLGQGDSENRGDGPGEMGDQLQLINLGRSIISDGLTAGAGHACVYLTDETIKCWGNNGSGQLGQGDKLSRGDEPDEMGDFLVPIDLGPA